MRGPHCDEPTSLLRCQMSRPYARFSARWSFSLQVNTAPSPGSGPPLGAASGTAAAAASPTAAAAALLDREDLIEKNRAEGGASPSGAASGSDGECGLDDAAVLVPKPIFILSDCTGGRIFGAGRPRAAEAEQPGTVLSSQCAPSC
jgi:hypothetical protein